MTILSKDIQSLVPSDKIQDSYLVKRKIQWGADGTANDVSQATPLPVQGTFTQGSPGWVSFGQSTPKTVPVNNVSVVLLSENLNRVNAQIINNTDQLIYIQYGVDAELGRGIPLFTHAVWEINNTNLFLGQISAITNTGTPVLIDVIEGVQ